MAIKPKWILIGLLAAGFLLRTICLHHVPPALNSDELLKAFDGASVYRTGMDHHGDSWPLFFKQSGEYSPPLYIYFAGLFSAFFGNNAYTVRLPSAVLGTLSILLIFLFVKEFTSQYIALCAAALLTVSPWSVFYSRIGWEAILQTPLQLAALIMLMKWIKHLRWYWISGSCLFFGLTVYSYPTARLFIPLWLIGIFIIYIRTFWTYRWQTTGGIGILVLIVLPLLLFSITHYQAMQARFEFLSVFNRPDGMTLFLQQYVQHLSPLFMFWSGNPTYMNLAGAGTALVVLLPFFLLGLFGIIRKREPIGLVLLIWLVLFAVPASMTYDRYDIHSMPSPLRASCGIGLIEIISALGIGTCFNFIISARLQSLSKYVFATIIGINGGITYYDYFMHYPIRSAERWQVGLREAVEYIESHKAEYDRVVISHKVRLHPVALAVFSGHPAEPFSGDDYSKYILPFYHYVPVYRDFGHEDYHMYRGQKYGSIARWYNLAPGKNLYLAKAGDITDKTPIKTITYPDGKPAYEFYARE